MSATATSTTHRSHSKPLPYVIAFGRRESIPDELEAVPDDIGAVAVCLDFANVHSIHSSELSALIRFSLRMKELGKSICVAHVGRHIEEVFAVTRFRVERLV